MWDGTRCPHKLLKVMVQPDVIEGPSSFPEERETIIADILVYDNHVEFARHLKVRSQRRNTKCDEVLAPRQSS